MEKYLNHMELGLQILSRLRESAANGNADHSYGEPSPMVSVSNRKGWNWRIPLLSEILDELGTLPAYSALVGKCEDGLPILMDLTNPSYGSILIAGDRQSGKTHLLRTILMSAARLNPVALVKMICICTRPSELSDILSLPHCYQVIKPFERQAKDTILALAEVVEQRRYGRQPGAAVLVAIDDFSALVENLDEQTLEQLAWLLKVGPHSQVFVVATAQVGQFEGLPSNLLEAFGTCIAGSMASSEPIARATGRRRFDFDVRNMRAQFQVQIGQEKLDFWAPALG